MFKFKTTVTDILFIKFDISLDKSLIFFHEQFQGTYMEEKA